MNTVEFTIGFVFFGAFNWNCCHKSFL